MPETIPSAVKILASLLFVVVRDIKKSLHFKDPVLTFTSSVFRPNLFYDIAFKNLMTDPFENLQSFIYEAMGENWEDEPQWQASRKSLVSYIYPSLFSKLVKRKKAKTKCKVCFLQILILKITLSTMCTFSFSSLTNMQEDLLPNLREPFSFVNAGDNLMQNLDYATSPHILE
ncbi:ATP-dependent DNA helicase Q5 [Nymphon striatum]|nr:ATP-dependent DNA helicase Q5 [Nymphon striatum]